MPPRLLPPLFPYSSRRAPEAGLNEADNASGWHIRVVPSGWEAALRNPRATGTLSAYRSIHGFLLVPHHFKPGSSTPSTDQRRISTGEYSERGLCDLPRDPAREDTMRVKSLWRRRDGVIVEEASGEDLRLPTTTPTWTHTYVAKDAPDILTNPLQRGSTVRDRTASEHKKSQ
ncbi:hypothetical protein BX600DRAFT_491498 [Xylariales sp. PMI_506]|nr:hypothetical protein BX600DRAFT_491498 [Xylariales sp. PMI_506]